VAKLNSKPILTLKENIMIGYPISYDNNLEENCSLTSEKVVKKTKEY